MEAIVVNMGRYEVSNNSTELVCVGLGSCVGIALYDAVHKIGALAHVVLPKQSEGKNKGNKYKYADASIEAMLEEMEEQGAERRSTRAKLFGGANMFPHVLGSKILRIGERNLEAVKEELTKRKIKIVAEEVGGHFGRTIYFNVKTGDVRVRDIHGEERIC